MSGFCLVSGLALALGLSGQLEITQGTYRTSGAVVWSGQEGTYILTCKHYRDPALKWTAREGGRTLQGEHTLLSRTEDLALLWTRERWVGLVYDIAPKAPATLPVVFVNDRTLPKPWPFGCPLYRLEEQNEPGSSGRPLLRDGKLIGVCWGKVDGASAYIRHDSIMRFLNEAQGKSQLQESTRNMVRRSQPAPTVHRVSYGR